MPLFQNIIGLAIVPIAIVLFVACMIYEQQDRQRIRATAWQEGLGEEFDLELSKQIRLRRLMPKDGPTGPEPYAEALEIVRLEHQVKTKHAIPNKETNQMTFSQSVVVFGDVKDIHTSISNLYNAGQQQVALSVEGLTKALTEWKDVREDERKHLLENLAVVSHEASASPDQRKTGLLKSSLSFLTTSLGAANNLIPLVHDLHEKLRSAGVIDW